MARAPMEKNALNMVASVAMELELMRYTESARRMLKVAARTIIMRNWPRPEVVATLQGRSFHLGWQTDSRSDLAALHLLLGGGGDAGRDVGACKRPAALAGLFVRIYLTQTPHPVDGRYFLPGQSRTIETHGRADSSGHAWTASAGAAAVAGRGERARRSHHLHGTTARCAHRRALWRELFFGSLRSH